MSKRVPTRARLLLVLAVAAAAFGAAGIAGADAGPATKAEAAVPPVVYLPLVLKHFDGPFPTVVPRPSSGPTRAPSGTALPSATAPTPVATGSATGGATGAPSAGPTTDPSATPSVPAPPIEHPRDADTIILQIGWTDTTQVSQVFEEMNGTPWLTLYGDGRLIAGTSLFNTLQPLSDGAVGDAVTQRWLGRLVRDAGLFDLKSDYHHPRLSTPEVHIYAHTSEGAKRVSLRSFKQFEQWGVPEELPEAASIVALIDLVRDIEAELIARAAPAATPFAPDCYTILSQQMYGYEDVASQFETWDHSLNVRAIAVAAPTAASNYIGKVVGHKFVGGDLGRQIQAVVRPQWEYWFSSQNIAAAFRVGPLPYAVGARQEVPGGSLFLPAGGFDDRGNFWYRRDPGSGSCPSLPRASGAAPAIDMPDAPIDEPATSVEVTAWLRRLALADAHGPRREAEGPRSPWAAQRAVPGP